MIEGEEILESAQETGYRLCVSPVDNNDEDGEWNKIFSAQWDPCQESRLYVCSQKGQLRAYNVDDGSYRTYRILFRKHSSDFKELQDDGRPIAYHWDKMVAIPERPDEFVFLLGVSKNLMYTALPGTVPYPEEPFISGTTRSDFTGYIYGTPVMELWTHVARITSIAVNTTGQVLASGDEQGNLKLLVLRLLDQLIITQKGAKDKKSSAQIPAFSSFLPEYKLTMRAHTHGPIFAMQWLPMPTLPPLGGDEDSFNAARRTRYYSLATGSLDCAVRIWGITCSVQKGLTIAPIMVLDTLNTQTLSLHGYLSITKPTAEQEIQRKHIHRSREGDKSKSNVPFEIPDPSSIYLAAGTNTGTVYVWRLDTRETFDVVAGLGASSGIGTSNRPRLIDDGSHLHSLLQSSDRPIVSVSISITMDSLLGPKAPKKICLVAADSSSCVRSHRESDYQSDMEGADDGSSGKRGSVRGSDQWSQSGAAAVGSLVDVATTVQKSSLAKYPIVLCGEMHHSHAVVISASFQERQPVDFACPDAPAKTSVDTWTIPSAAGKHIMGSRLLLGTSNGQLQVLDTEGVYFHRDQLEVGLHGGANHPIADAVATAASSTKSATTTGTTAPTTTTAAARSQMLATSTDRTSSERDSMHTGPLVVNRTASASASVPVPERVPTSGQAAVSKAFNAVAQHSVMSAESATSSISYDKTNQMNVPISDSVGSSTVQTANLTAKGQGSGSRVESAAAAQRVNGSNECPPQSSALPHHAPTPTKKRDTSPTPQAAAPTPTPVTLAPRTGSKPLSSTENPTGRKRVTMVQPSTGQSPLSLINDSAPNQDHVTESQGGASKSTKEAGDGRASREAPNQDHVTESQGGGSKSTKEAGGGRASREEAPQEKAGKAVSKSSMRQNETSAGLGSVMEVLQKRPPPLPPKTIPLNSYTSPTLNSSLAIQSQLNAITQRLQNDDISVASISTTTSARMSAADVVNVPMDSPRYRAGLTPVLDANEIAFHLASGQTSTRINTRKATDPTWLHRQMHTAPNIDALSPLHTPDPAVVLSSSVAGLVCGCDEGTLLPSFVLGIDAGKVFGDSTDELAERRVGQAAQMLDLVLI